MVAGAAGAGGVATRSADLSATGAVGFCSAASSLCSTSSIFANNSGCTTAGCCPFGSSEELEDVVHDDARLLSTMIRRICVVFIQALFKCLCKQIYIQF